MGIAEAALLEFSNQQRSIQLAAQRKEHADTEQPSVEMGNLKMARFERRPELVAAARSREVR
jgi:hypothetical protein